MKGNNYKKNIDGDTYLLYRDLNLLLEIFTNGEKLANEKAKEARIEMKILEKHNNAMLQSGTLTGDEDKAYNNFINFAFHFNYLTLHALFVSAYSFFENYLMTISKQLENYSDSNIMIKDMSKDKSDLDRLRKYLNLVHNLQFAKSDNSNWLKIVKFQKIRNAIVHNNNHFPNDNNKELITLLKSYDVYMPREYDFQIKDKSFLSDFNGLVTLYARELNNEICQMQ